MKAEADLYLISVIDEPTSLMDEHISLIIEWLDMLIDPFLLEANTVFSFVSPFNSRLINFSFQIMSTRFYQPH